MKSFINPVERTIARYERELAILERELDEAEKNMYCWEEEYYKCQSFENINGLNLQKIKVDNLSNKVEELKETLVSLNRTLSRY